jgi:preprotein translocase SecE subunit
VEEKSKKPRIRKTAPTVRQRVEAAQEAATKEKPQRLSKVKAKVPRPSKFINLPSLPDNRFTRVLRKIGRGFKRVLGWLTPRYIINSWRELKLVTWPSRRETWRLTFAVFMFSIVFGGLVAIVDKGLDEIFKKVILK